MKEHVEAARPRYLSRKYEDDIARTTHNERRFWGFVSIGRCWEWTGHSNSKGYGRIALNQRKPVAAMAHRLAYRWFVGPIVGDNTIDHLCRNPRCVNPAHLEQVSMRENQLRGTSPMAANHSKTHCPQGHPLSGENLIVRSKPGRLPFRMCRECDRGRQKRFRDARKSAALNACDTETT